MALFAAKGKSFTRSFGRGKTQIVRASYSSKTTSWWQLEKEVKQRDGYCCVQCHISEADSQAKYGKMLQVHHRIPLSRGGLTRKYNLVTLCIKCHEAKH